MTSQPHASPAHEDKVSEQSISDVAQEPGQHIKETSVNEVRNVAETAATEAKSVASDVRSEATRLLTDTKAEVSEQVKAQAGHAALSLRQVADGMTSMAESSQESDLAAQLVHQGGDLTRRAADYLEDRDPSTMLDDLREFARRRPGTFLLGAVVAGVVVGRLSRVAMSVEDTGSNGSTGAGTSTPVPTATHGYAGASGEPLVSDASASGASSARTQAEPTVPGVSEPVGTTGLRP